MIDVYLIRHAECENNCLRERIWGQTNSSPLTKYGEIQAEALEKRLRMEGVVFDAVYSSPAIRALETIVRVAPYYVKDKIIIAPELQEIDQGKWTGKLRSEIYTPEQIAIINKDNWNFAAPEGESQAQVGSRVYRVVEEAVIHSPKKIKNVGFSMHGISIKCLLSLLLRSDKSMTWRWEINNASITQFRYEQKVW